MSMPLPASLWQPRSPQVSSPAASKPAPSKVRPNRGLSPEALLEAGILCDTRTPQGALQRGRALLRQGQFREAKAVLQAHSNVKDPSLAAPILELLARCAAGTAGKDRESSLLRAKQAYKSIGAPDGVARCEQLLGELAADSGDFESAQTYLGAAATLLESLRQPSACAVVRSVQARLLLQAGSLSAALRQVESALAMARHERHQRSEGLVRLERAQILVAAGRFGDAARDVIYAERVFAASPDQAIAARIRLIHAEMLMAAGQEARAAAGLRRVIADSNNIEDVGIRAWCQEALGRALLELDSGAARRFLSRARHLYDTMGAAYSATRCDIALARVEFRLGLNPRGRLKQLATIPMEHWEPLRMQLAIARAESDPEDAAQAALLEARRDAIASGYHALARQIDTVLRRQDPGDQQLQELTPVDTLAATDPSAVVATITATPIEDTKPVGISEYRPLARTLKTRPTTPRSLIQVDNSNPGQPRLAPPRAAGVGNVVS